MLVKTVSAQEMEDRVFEEIEATRLQDKVIQMPNVTTSSLEVNQEPHDVSHHCHFDVNHHHEVFVDFEGLLDMTQGRVKSPDLIEDNKDNMLGKNSALSSNDDDERGCRDKKKEEKDPSCLLVSSKKQRHDINTPDKRNSLPETVRQPKSQVMSHEHRDHDEEDQEASSSEEEHEKTSRTLLPSFITSSITKMTKTLSSPRVKSEPKNITEVKTTFKAETSSSSNSSQIDSSAAFMSQASVLYMLYILYKYFGSRLHDHDEFCILFDMSCHSVSFVCASLLSDTLVMFVIPVVISC